jgi:hypothetical protein
MQDNSKAQELIILCVMGYNWNISNISINNQYFNTKYILLFQQMMLII